MPADHAKLEALFATTGVAALATLRRDGRPQLSNILYHYDQRTRTFSVSITARVTASASTAFCCSDLPE